MAAVLAVLLVVFSLTSYGPAEPVAALLSSSGGSAVVNEVPRSLYSNATEMLVGAMLIESFSSARANGPIGENVTGHGLIAGGEAICNCACYAADDFTFCRNTAKTTVGVATYAYDPQLRRWEARGLRFFRAGSPGAERQGRSRTSFVAEGVLPRGPGGPMRFYSTYIGDVVADGDGRSAEIVRARTSGVACEAAPLCDEQCSDEAQYRSWKRRCHSNVNVEPPRKSVRK